MTEEEKILHWVLTETAKSFCDAFPDISKKSRLREFTNTERLWLNMAGLISIGIESGTPEVITPTINLHKNERLCDAVDNLKQGLKRRGLSTSITWTGVEVPETISGKTNKHQKHGHVALHGISPHTPEWSALHEWLKGRNRRSPRSVNVKWAYSLEGLVGYFLCYRNFGVRGARIPVARGQLHQHAEGIGKQGIEFLRDSLLSYSVS